LYIVLSPGLDAYVHKGAGASPTPLDDASAAVIERGIFGSDTTIKYDTLKY
jgi:hypothetical protein